MENEIIKCQTRSIQNVQRGNGVLGFAMRPVDGLEPSLKPLMACVNVCLPSFACWLWAFTWATDCSHILRLVVKQKELVELQPNWRRHFTYLSLSSSGL
jgi:hypothetical protein